MTLSTLTAVEAQLRRWNGKQEEPPGSNLIIFNREYFGSNVKAAWCATFISTCFKWAGHTEFPQHSYTPSGAAAAKAKWGVLGRNTRLQKGDVIWFHWADMGRIAHIGWFSHYEGDVLRVWEGNTDGGGSRTGGQVMLQRRSRATIGESRGGIVVRVPYFDNYVPAPIPVILKEEDVVILKDSKKDTWLYSVGTTPVHIVSGIDNAEFVKRLGEPIPVSDDQMQEFGIEIIH